MKKFIFITVALLSANFLFAFEKNDKENFRLAKTDDFVLNNNKLPNPILKKVTKHGRGSDAFAEGTMVISAGYGFPNWGKTLFKAFQDYTDYKVTGFGPLHAKFEYGLSDKIGLGASINYVAYGSTWNTSYLDYNPSTGLYENKVYNEGWDVTSISFLARMNLHFATTDKLDPYWGIGVGYKATSLKWQTDYPGSSTSGTLSSPIPFGLETTIGMRYYFSDNIGAYLEMGIAKSIFQGGLALKF